MWVRARVRVRVFHIVVDDFSFCVSEKALGLESGLGLELITSSVSSRTVSALASNLMVVGKSEWARKKE